MTRFVFVRNLDRPTSPLTPVKFCDSFLCRLRGLTFHRRIRPDEGLLLVQKRDSRLDAAIHMLGVGFDLTIVWINDDLRVVDKALARAWRPAYIPRRPARYVLEVHPDRWADYEIGDRVEMLNA